MRKTELTDQAYTKLSNVGARTSFDSVLSSVSSNDSHKPGFQARLDTNLRSHVVRRPSLLDSQEEQSLAATATEEPVKKHKDEPVTWMSLPHKGQLAVLTIARLSEPLSERSLAAYMFYQLRWFDSSLPDSSIASQGGFLTAAFAAAQFLTAVWWGRAADTPWIGRKRVLLVGLTGTAIASIGVGFSKSFYQALFFRALAGALNGNIGVMRTMLSEIVKEKKFQSRAFLLLPMCFNIGVVVGPILGGFLADPISAFPDTFGPGSRLGGEDGVRWMVSFPYALPNLFSGVFILISALSVILGLDETHEALRNKPDYGRKVGKFIARLIHCRKPDDDGYTRVATDDLEMTRASMIPRRPSFTSTSPANASVYPRSVPADTEVESPPSSSKRASTSSIKSPFRAILTRNVLTTLTAHHLLAMHISTFNALVFLLLPAPHSANKDHHFPSLRWTGGLGLSQSRVGLAMAILGIIGLPLQILLYPPLNTKMGTLPAYRTFLPFSIVAYVFIPFLSLLPSRPAFPVWAGLCLILGSQVLSRTFALTGTVILVNNASPTPSALGTLHGVAQSVSSAARMMGPIVGGWLLGLGLQNNFVGGVWWGMAAVAIINWALLFCIYEGDGHGGRA